MILSQELRGEMISYRQQFESELHSILNYWIQNAPDQESGGFYGAVNLNNEPVANAARSCVLTARILWTFSAAEMNFPDRGYRQMADRAYEVLQKYFHDRENDGYYMELDANHQVVNSMKHTYAQAFVLYAFAKYFELNHSEEVLKRILGFFNFLDQKAFIEKANAYQEGFSRDWKPILENRMADDNDPFSMNTHLHLLEAYSSVFQVTGDPPVKDRLKHLCLLFQEKIIRKDGHLGIFFDADFNETEGSRALCSFGHDIEGSWLIREAFENLGDRLLIDEIEPVLIQMAKNVFRLGVDHDGGLFLESSRFGSHVRTNKHWWLQAELLVGELNAYQLTGTIQYWNLVKRTWRFINRYVIDHEKGEWYTKVSRLGKPYLEEPADDPSPYYRNDWKIDPWKCPYHNGRAMLELIKRIDKTLK